MLINQFLCTKEIKSISNRNQNIYIRNVDCSSISTRNTDGWTCQETDTERISQNEKEPQKMCQELQLGTSEIVY